MNYTDVYMKGAKLFEMWCPIYVCRYGTLRSGHIRAFLYEMTRGWKLVPGLEHIEGIGCSGTPNLTDEQKEMIYKYFHDNPEVYLKYLFGF